MEINIAKKGYGAIAWAGLIFSIILSIVLIPYTKQGATFFQILLFALIGTEIFERITEKIFIGHNSIIITKKDFLGFFRKDKEYYFSEIFWEFGKVPCKLGGCYGITFKWISNKKRFDEITDESVDVDELKKILKLLDSAKEKYQATIN
jgi:hypothetical protein